MLVNRTVLALVAALLVPDALGYFGVFVWLGAHPFWDIKVAVIGSSVGAVVGMALQWAGRHGRLGGVLLLCVSAGAAVYGKSRFVASYAEDALAGKLWFFGWIGVTTGLSLLIFALIAPARR